MSRFISLIQTFRGVSIGMGPSDLRWKITLCTRWIWKFQVPGFKEVEQMRTSYRDLNDCNVHEYLYQITVNIVPRVNARAKHALHVLVIIISFKYQIISMRY